MVRASDKMKNLGEDRTKGPTVPVFSVCGFHLNRMMHLEHGHLVTTWTWLGETEHTSLDQGHTILSKMLAVCVKHKLCNNMLWNDRVSIRYMFHP